VLQWAWANGRLPAPHDYVAIAMGGGSAERACVDAAASGGQIAVLVAMGGKVIFMPPCLFH
jgi:hypothetical protein